MLEAAYITLTVVTNIFLVFIGYKGIGNASPRASSRKVLLVIGLILWQLFIFFFANTEILQSYDFPPRFAIAFIVPSFIFIGIFLYANRNNDWIKRIPEQWIICFQSFRIVVETLFILSLTKGIFNYEVTIEGYNFDMIFALTAPIVAYSAYAKQWLPRKLILIWNYLGLAVLASVIFLFMNSIYNPQLFDSEVPLLPLISMSYPYVLIAGFLMPTAVFLHVLSIIQVSLN